MNDRPSARGVWVMALLCAHVAGCGSDGLPLDGAADPGLEAVRDKISPQALAAILAGEETPLLVLVDADPAADDDADVARARWRARKDAALALAPELPVERTWDELPLVQLRARELRPVLSLLRSDDVVFAFDDARLEAFDAESFALIHEPQAAAQGFTAAGTTVAVLDTGCDYRRAAFGSCTAPGQPTGCRVVYARDFAPDDGALDDNGHGTNVAGIVAGVAPGARIIALDVFSGAGASTSTIVDAINWVIATQATYKTTAINLSLGGGSATAPCANDAIGAAIAAARKVRIATAVASGNSGWSTALAAPACAPAAVSVGAVYDANLGGIGYGNCSDATTAADKITCFSNSASFLTVLAPGALIDAAGYVMAGTSQASPHVAGVLATLLAAYPTETVDQAVARLVTAGTPIRDPRNGITKPRIDVAAAAIPPDKTPPVGTVRIEGGAALTPKPTVSLAITATDPSGVAAMCVTNTTTCTTFTAFQASVAWTLASGDGKKTVTVFLRDGKGNTTAASSSPTATITLDATPPRDGTLTVATATAGQAALAWTAATDLTTSVASYRVAMASGTTPPAGCGTGVLWTGVTRSYTATGLTKGKAYAFRVCAVDTAGNVSGGALANGSIK